MGNPKQNIRRGEIHSPALFHGKNITCRARIHQKPNVELKTGQSGRGKRLEDKKKGQRSKNRYNKW
jgi:hypothetical protein